MPDAGQAIARDRRGEATRRDLPEVAFHIVEGENWAHLRREGLMSARDLLAANGLPAACGWRQETLILPDGRVIRDQRPMPPAALARCLDDALSPDDWYDLLNGCVFFWLDEARVQRHAKALAKRDQILLRLDARRLAAAYAQHVRLSPFNLGAAIRRPARRGLRTLVPLEDWRRDAWKTEALHGMTPRSPSHAPAEMIVLTAIPDLDEFVMTAEALPARAG
ncbi:DUF7002 family protein [Plastoroseomonas hellenica]|uniref:DUF7002 family protein n=1 Tax=Plastoroseomonas hellenica TaxID=2687306 RepID=UPI001BA7B24E|nr:hypothetical protein [Plastoroseomonas hellenica]MBR0647167.1 hypothetical protein [Plastoroseomonas hellenica]